MASGCEKLLLPHSTRSRVKTITHELPRDVEVIQITTKSRVGEVYQKVVESMTYN